MTGRILIIDPVATHRIVLKVKMAAAQYAVTACESCGEARKALLGEPPDLILIALSGGLPDGFDFCRELRAAQPGQNVAIVAVGGTDTASSRFAALDAGVDDVLPNPVSDNLLMSRVRAILRRRNMGSDLHLHDGTNRAFGFEEERQLIVTPPRIGVISRDAARGVALVQALQEKFGRCVKLTNLQNGVSLRKDALVHDLIVIDAIPEYTRADGIYRLICDLRARAETRFSALIVRLPQDVQDMAAMALDLGADDVIFEDADTRELHLRCVAALANKTRADSMRDRVRRGLQAALTDPLTGLANRRQAEAQLRAVIEQARMGGTSFAVLMLDIDHFKSVNDRFGHSAGDAVLKDVATRLKETFRDGDLVARVGGEEFMVVIPESDADHALAAAERLRRRVNGAPFALPGRAEPERITVSVGVATSVANDAETEDIEALFHRADTALYCAKNAGRDAVSLSAA